MTRRKYEITAGVNTIQILWSCLCRREASSNSDDMLAFHSELDIQIRRGQGRHDNGRFYVRFCFSNPPHADAFRDQFGGEWIARSN